MPLIGVTQGPGGAPRGAMGGATSTGAGGEGLDLNELMDYVGKAFGSANADVSDCYVHLPPMFNRCFFVLVFFACTRCSADPLCMLCGSAVGALWYPN